MSSFSSVVRKPGQKITPKAAPRRNVQRHAQKPSRPVASTLTPESLPQSPSSQIAQPPSVVDDDGSRQTIADAVRTLTPPTTIPDPASREDEDGQTRTTSRGPPHEIGIASPDRVRESRVPVVATTDTSPNTRQKRRAGVGDPSGSVQNTVPIPSPQRIDPASPATKRRKIAPPEAAPIAVSQPVQAPVAPRRTSSHRDDVLTPGADADLQVVSSRLRTVSELANSIETRARASRSRTGRRSTADTDSEYEEPESQSPRSRDRASKSVAIEDAAAAVVAKAVRGSKRGRARHRRGQTPEDAEDHQIDATKTSMVDLVADSGLGKRSETGKRLESEWVDIKQRWDQKLEDNRSKAKMKPAQRKAARTTDRIPDAAEERESSVGAAAQMKMIIVDGQITVAEESRQLDFSHNIEARANIIDESLVQTDERIYNYVNQNRIGKNAGLRSTTKWSTELTDKLYQGLRMFGTDFELITSLFGGNWTRRQIKAKFVREERLNLDKVKAALAEREQVDLNGYGSFIEGGIEGLRDPKEIEAELAAEEKKIRDEYEKSRRGDHFVEDEADQPLESIETDQAADGEGERPSATPGLEGNRYAGLADRIVRKATQPRKKQPQKHRENTGTSKTGGAGRRGTRGKKPLEGVEERIGNVHDVEL